MTVRELIEALVVAAPSLESTVSCSVVSGTNVVAFWPIAAGEVVMDRSEGHVNIMMDSPQAFDLETEAELPTGVLTLE